MRFLGLLLFAGAVGAQVEYRVSTVLGGTTLQDGPGYDCLLSSPGDMVVDPFGNILFLDNYSMMVRVLRTDGTVRTLWTAKPGPQNSPSFFRSVGGIAVDGSGAAYITAGSQVLRVTTSGASVLATGAFPWGIALDGRGNVYFSERGGHRIRRLGSDGTLVTIAGTGVTGLGADGPALASSLNTPSALTLDSDNNVYFFEETNARIRRVDPQGVITTIAGNPDGGALTEGADARRVKLPFLNNLTIARDGSVQFESSGAVWRIDGGMLRRVTSLSGLFVSGFTVNRDNEYVVSSGNLLLRVTSTGTRVSLAGRAPLNNAERMARGVVELVTPDSVALDRNGTLYVGDSGTNQVYRLTTGGVASIVAGNGTRGRAGMAARRKMLRSIPRVRSRLTGVETSISQNWHESAR